MFEPPYIFQQHLLGDRWFTPFSSSLCDNTWSIQNTLGRGRVTRGPPGSRRVPTLGNSWWHMDEDSEEDDEEELSDGIELEFYGGNISSGEEGLGDGASGDVTNDEDSYGHGFDETREYPRNVDIPAQDRTRGFREIPIQFERAEQKLPIQFERAEQKLPTHKLFTPEKLSRFIANLPETEDELTPLSNDGDPWIANLKLTMKDKRELEEGRMLTDKHIYAAQQLLKQQFPWVSGLQDTCLSQTCFSKVNSEGVQIHHTRGNHWVVSACIGGQVQVLDSLYDKLGSDLWKQLGEIYPNASQDGKKLVVEIPPVQKQRGGKDCGLFAIVMAYELCQGNSVLGLYFDQAQMREHLLQCFQQERLQPFPRRSRKTDCLVANFEVVLL